MVRRFAQPLGIHLDTWTDRIIETRKGTVRLLPVAERAHQLFGADDVSAIATAIERDRKRAAQLDLFPEPEPPPRLRTRRLRPRRRSCCDLNRATFRAARLISVRIAFQSASRLLIAKNFSNNAKAS